MAENLRIPHPKNTFLISAYRVLGSSTDSPIGKFYPRETAVLPPTPIQERITLPDPNPEQAAQLGRHASLVPENDFAILLGKVVEAVHNESTDLVVFSAQELIESPDKITSRTVAFAERFHPNIVVFEDAGDRKIIVQNADVLTAAYDSTAGDMD